MHWSVDKSKILEEVSSFTPSVHYDFRGEIFSTFNSEFFSSYVDSPFVEDKISVSKKNVLRGLHGDFITDKLVQCLKGEFYLVVMDWREDSKTYKQWDSFILNDKNRKQVLIPKGFVNGHLCLSEECIFSYKQTEFYSGADNQISINWEDPSHDVFWPIDFPILSLRDMTV
jgi:dTDP-4-dehydrorhamnose 3,5-epimerase